MNQLKKKVISIFKKLTFLDEVLLKRFSNLKNIERFIPKSCLISCESLKENENINSNFILNYENFTSNFINSEDIDGVKLEENDFEETFETIRNQANSPTYSYFDSYLKLERSDPKKLRKIMNDLRLNNINIT